MRTGSKLHTPVRANRAAGSGVGMTSEVTRLVAAGEVRQQMMSGHGSAR
ncbi:MAG: hypothetical protein JWO57_3341 [Pseudonocardiales bacterium]|nr:hypothetical protein [Pseudonocardiales bacterium]